MIAITIAIACICIVAVAFLSLFCRWLSRELERTRKRAAELAYELGLEQAVCLRALNDRVMTAAALSTVMLHGGEHLYSNENMTALKLNLDQFEASRKVVLEFDRIEEKNAVYVTASEAVPEQERICN